MGNGGVGKSALTMRFVADKFEEHYNPTIEDSYRKTKKVDLATVTFDILDTAGQEEYSELREVYIRGGECFVLVYSVADDNTFNDISKFFELIQRVKEGTNCVVVLAGNKCDLDGDRVVSTQQGLEMAKRYNAVFLETSAKTGLNVEDLFAALAKESMSLEQP